MPGPDLTGGAPPNPLERASRSVALAGGLISLAIAALVVASVLMRWAGIGSAPGDFELVQMGTAIAAFCFLPLCQARRGNIMVDSFTSRLPPRANRIIDAFWDLVYAAVMMILAVSLLQGAQGVLGNGTNTIALGLPLWPAIVVASELTFFLALVAILGAVALVRSGS